MKSRYGQVLVLSLLGLAFVGGARAKTEQDLRKYLEDLAQEYNQIQQDKQQLETALQQRPDLQQAIVQEYAALQQKEQQIQNDMTALQTVLQDPKLLQQALAESDGVNPGGKNTYTQEELAKMFEASALPEGTTAATQGNEQPNAQASQLSTEGGTQTGVKPTYTPEEIERMYDAPASETPLENSTATLQAGSTVMPQAQPTSNVGMTSGVAQPSAALPPGGSMTSGMMQANVPLSSNVGTLNGAVQAMPTQTMVTPANLPMMPSIPQNVSRQALPAQASAAVPVAAPVARQETIQTVRKEVVFLPAGKEYILMERPKVVNGETVGPQDVYLLPNGHEYMIVNVPTEKEAVQQRRLMGTPYTPPAQGHVQLPYALG